MPNPAAPRDLAKHWPQIMKLTERAFPKYIFATTNADGSPHVTPMGSFNLRDDCSGFYFEEYSRQLRGNLERDNRISVLVLDFRLLAWIPSLITGRFAMPNAVRLNGTASPRRPATTAERDAFKRDQWPVSLARILNLRGYRFLWKPLAIVRDIQFHAFEPVDLGRMGRGHWAP